MLAAEVLDGHVGISFAYQANDLLVGKTFLRFQSPVIEDWTPNRFATQSWATSPELSGQGRRSAADRVAAVAGGRYGVRG